MVYKKGKGVFGFFKIKFMLVKLVKLVVNKVFVKKSVVKKVFVKEKVFVKFV